MYLFSRRARLRPGSTRESLAWATEQAERVTRISGLQVNLWSQVFSPAMGTLVWATFVPDLTALEEANDKLMVDDEYLSAIDAGAAFLEGPIDDSLLSVLAGEPDPEREVSYVASVQAVCAAGHLARGIEVGMTIAAKVTEVTGEPTMFATASTGPYGGVAWLTGYSDVASLDGPRPRWPPMPSSSATSTRRPEARIWKTPGSRRSCTTGGWSEQLRHRARGIGIGGVVRRTPLRSDPQRLESSVGPAGATSDAVSAAVPSSGAVTQPTVYDVIDSAP